MMRRLIPAAVIATMVLVGCTPADEPGAPETGQSETTAPTNGQSPDTSTPASSASTEPEESEGPTGTEPGFDTQAKQTEGFPELSGVQLLPTRVRVAHHEGYDRVVVEFTGDDTPGYRAQYVAEAAEPGSGEPITVAGDHVLEVIITGTRIPEEDEDYAERADYPVNDAEVVRGVNFFPPYEGQSQLVIGVAGEAPFRVQTLTGPTRLVIDIQTD